MTYIDSSPLFRPPLRNPGPIVAVPVCLKHRKALKANRCARCINESKTELQRAKEHSDRVYRYLMKRYKNA